jgi:hypothetical protein
LQRIADKIKADDERTGFLENFVKENGFICWEYADFLPAKKRRNAALLETGNTTVVVLLPTVPLDADVVKSIIAAEANMTDVYLKLYQDKKYASYGFDLSTDRDKPNANDVVLRVMAFQKEIFNNTYFKVTDERLYDKQLDGEVRPESFYVTAIFYQTPGEEDCWEVAEIITTTNNATGAVTQEFTGNYWYYGSCNGWGGGINFGGFWGNGGEDPSVSSGSGGGSGTPSPDNCLGWYRVVPNYDGSGFEPVEVPCVEPILVDNITPPFIWAFSEDDGTSFIDSDPIRQPAFTFELTDNYETLYPRFTEIVKNLKTFVKNNPKVLNALQKYSGFSKQQILDKLTYGSGPTIKVEEMTGKFGFYNKNNGLNTLHIRASYIRGLEQSFLESTKEATGFLLAVTILHEFVHLGTSQNNISEGVYDFGFGFERDAFNVLVSDENAGSVVIKFNSYF